MRKHFATFPITDVKFFPFRRIGYVGYKTPEDAAAAVKYFNKSFIKLTKIYAEIARPIADKELPKSRRQLKLEKAAAQRNNDAWISAETVENEKKRKRDEAERDPKLREFLDVYQAPSKTNVWNNGDMQVDVAAASTAEVLETVAVVPEDESDDEYQTISKRAKTSSELPEALTPQTPIQKVEQTTEVIENTGPAGEAEILEEPVPDQGPVSDADWLRSRTKRALDLVEDDELPIEPVKAPSPSRVVPLKQSSPPRAVPEPKSIINDAEKETEAAVPEEDEEDKIRETGRLYLRNLHFDVTEDELRNHFSKYPSLEEVGSFPVPFHFLTLFVAMMNVKIGTTDA